MNRTMDSDTRSTSEVTAATDADEGTLPAVVRSRPDGSERLICYAPDVDTADVEDQWLSVDAEFPVSTLLMR
ncbi:hypothetical protein GCM10009006_19920 [Haloarcula argentinensis]|uniref:Uncharacterized protein n=2 Tax=Haloarcula argentinensis TaxID=43776 RepID=A0A830FMP2_HALAR|nr:hypothetical protein GCM10009006_19920 [Haloarcula argentinensis]